jgi:hypothetical protein
MFYYISCFKFTSHIGTRPVTAYKDNNNFSTTEDFNNIFIFMKNSCTKIIILRNF